MKLLYIVYCESHLTGIMQSQVGSRLAVTCGRLGLQPAVLVLIEPFRIAFSKQTRQCTRLVRSVWPSGRIVVAPFADRLKAWSPEAALHVSVVLNSFDKKEEIVFHCRGPRTTLIADGVRRRIGRGRVVFDIRGSSAYEAIHRNGFRYPESLTDEVKRIYEMNRALDGKAATVADSILAVSPGLKSYLKELGASDDAVDVVPSCVAGTSFDPSIRSAVRKELGVEDDFVCVYSGRIGPERLPNLMVRLLRSLQSLGRNAKLLVLSYNTSEQFSKLVKNRMREGEVIFKQVPQKEVSRYLCAGDLGIVFYERALRYESAEFPIKFPEYLAAGLPIAINSYIEECPAIVRDRRIGIVVDSEDSDDEIMQRMSELVEELENRPEVVRLRCLQCCEDLYVWERYIARIRAAYGLGDGVR